MKPLLNAAAAESAYALFSEPTAAYRGKPFWSWNGKLDREEAIRQIHVLKKMGFGGFFMHSRTGLATEYLGEQWFELVNLCADEAERLGMEAWLYDEDRWPSGTAGGLVTERPEFRLKFIRLHVVSAAEYAGSGEHDAGSDPLAVFACRLNGFSYTDLRRLPTVGEPELGRDESVLIFTTEEQVRESFYNGYTYLDTLNPEAVGRFLELTHEKYKVHSGKRFGRAIKGIFTDEPHRGALMDGFSLKNEDAHWLAPWTYALFERFERKYGYDLVPKLPELFLQPEGRTVSQVKWHYTDLLQELFHESFLQPMNAWCRENGLVLTGHTLHEDSLSAQTAMVGSMMRFYEHMGYPGVDILTEGNRCYWVVKQLSSVARQLGQKWMMSELYGCTGWQMTLEGHKAVGDWQALFGINLRCHHLSWYTMEGESKRDFPASISYQSAWWQDYEQVETYFSRLGVVLSQGKPLCDLLVVHPVESLWCQIYPGWSRNLHGLSDSARRLESQFQEAFGWLAGAQVDFDYGDEEMMSRLGAVERDDSGAAVLRVGQAAYRAVLVTGLTTMRASTLALLEAFRQAGGRIIFAGEAPGYVDALPSADAGVMAETCVKVPFERDGLVGAVRDAVKAEVVVRDADTGKPLADVYVQVRRDGEVTYAILMNMDRTEWKRGVRVWLPEHAGEVEEWLCATGERKRVRTVRGAGRIDSVEWGNGGIDANFAAELAGVSFVVDFPPSGEHVYVLKDRCGPGASEPAGGDPLPCVERYADESSVELSGPYDYRLDEPNVLVLDQVKYRLDGDWQGPLEILKADRNLRDRLGLPYRSGEMIQPWYREKYMGKTLAETVPLELAFDFRVDALPQSTVYLAVERPERLRLTLNGTSISASTPKGWWIDPCFVKLAIPAGCLRKGMNRLVAQLDFHSGCDLEAMYLLGEFGVAFREGAQVMDRLPDRLAVGDIASQGLPFYGGTVTYRIDADRAAEGIERLGRKPGSRIALSLASFEAGTVRMRAGGVERRIPWAPYEVEIGESDPSPSASGASAAGMEIDLVLTRRNTFGPLHQWPLHEESYGPLNWVTEGDAFKRDYVLLPSGMLEAPRLVLKMPI